MTAQNQNPQNDAKQQPVPQGKKKNRRSASKEYALAARQRRLQQEYTNIHHPPAQDEFWICEFCEYESIFGHPPEALMRQYEIKDRKERRRQAEKRRLLEKAKMKGRKGKKANKNAAKGGNHTVQQPQQPRYDQQPADHHGILNQESEEYLDEGYDEEPTPMPAPAHAPVKNVLPDAPPSKIPQPVISNAAHGRGMGGGGTA